MDSDKMKQRVDENRRKVREENNPSTSSSIDAKFDIMKRTMERLMDKLALDNIPQNIDQHEPQIMNPNFRRPLPPHIRQREKIIPWNVEDQQIRPPFPENFVDEEEENDPMDN